MKGNEIKCLLDKYFANKASKEEVEKINTLYEKQIKENLKVERGEEELKRELFSGIKNRTVHRESKQVFLNRVDRIFITVSLLLLSAVLFTELIPWRSKGVVSTVYKSDNQVESFFLPDGTKIWLNQETEIRYTRNAGNRNVELLKGEIFVSVYKDTLNPFTVKVGTLVSTVHSTCVNVKSLYGGRMTDIVVKRGKAHIADGIRDLGTLGVNDLLCYDSHTRQTQRMKVNAMDRIKWRTEGMDIEDVTKLKRVVQTKPDQQIYKIITPYTI